MHGSSFALARYFSQPLYIFLPLLYSQAELSGVNLDVHRSKYFFEVPSVCCAARVYFSFFAAKRHAFFCAAPVHLHCALMPQCSMFSGLSQCKVFVVLPHCGLFVVVSQCSMFFMGIDTTTVQLITELQQCGMSCSGCHSAAFFCRQ